MAGRNLIGPGDVSRQWWDELYSLGCDMIARPGDYTDSCRGKVLATLFYEPSTRTNFSFQAAMMRLGGNVFGFSDPMGSSVSKGESLADTIRVAAAYSDAIVIRSPQEGAAAAAALYSEVPVVNAGDGSHFHPTQTLADLATIARKRGDIADMHIGFCGDLKHGRTVHSLVDALSMFHGVRYCLISPGALRMPEYLRGIMRSRGQGFTEAENLAEALPDLDVLYMTRIQRERFGDKTEYEKLKDVYVLTKDMLDYARADMLVMHPLPRYGEIAPEVDGDPRAAYFEQARYGMFIRMALLLQLSHMPRQAPFAGEHDGYGAQGAIADLGKCCNPVCVTQTERYLPQLVSTGGGARCGYCDALW